MKKLTKMQRAFVLILGTIVIFLLFYILNYYTPLMADDYSYSFSFATGERIRSVSDIIDSQINHFSRINGRSVTHTIAQLFLLIGDKNFNIINSLFFITLLFLIYFHSVGTFKNFSLTLFLILTGLIFLCTPAFGQSFLWVTGASNYLYGIFIILLFLIPYRLQATGRCDIKNNIALEIILSLFTLAFGIIAGWTNENNSIALISALIAFIINCKLKHFGLHLWNFSGLIGAIIGCIIMITAPGTNTRLNNSGGTGGIFSWIKRFIYISCDAVEYLNLMIIAIVLLLGVYILLQHKNSLKNKEIKNTLLNLSTVILFSIAFLASVYSMIVSPYFPKRAWSGPVIFLLIVIGNIFSLIDFSTKNMIISKQTGVALILLFSLATYFDAIIECKNVYSSFNQRETIITEAINSGKSTVEIPSIYGYSAYSIYDDIGDLNSNSTEWPNTAIAKYYGINEIEKQG